MDLLLPKIVLSSHKVDSKAVTSAYAKLDDMKKSESGSKFLIHIVRSFLPNKIQFNSTNENPICVLTGYKLHSLDTLTSQTADETRKSVLNYNLAISSSSTDKFLSQEAAIALYSFIEENREYLGMRSEEKSSGKPTFGDLPEFKKLKSLKL